MTQGHLDIGNPDSYVAGVPHREFARLRRASSSSRSACRARNRRRCSTSRRPAAARALVTGEATMPRLFFSSVLLGAFALAAACKPSVSTSGAGGAGAAGPTGATGGSTTDIGTTGDTTGGAGTAGGG